jgi:hypothetical protein
VCKNETDSQWVLPQPTHGRIIVITMWLVIVLYGLLRDPVLIYLQSGLRRHPRQTRFGARWEIAVAHHQDYE